MSGRPDVRVRAVEASDVDAVAEVHVRAWQGAYRGMIPDAYLDGLDVAARAQEWRGWLAEWPASSSCAVAERDGRVVGFAIAGSSSGSGRTTGLAGSSRTGRVVGQLHSFNVHPHAWGTGAAPALLEHVHGLLAAAGFGEAVLWVLPRNLRARRFYERHGWVADDGAARTGEVMGAVIDEVRYRRSLA